MLMMRTVVVYYCVAIFAFRFVNPFPFQRNKNLWPRPKLYRASAANNDVSQLLDQSSARVVPIVNIGGLNASASTSHDATVGSVEKARSELSSSLRDFEMNADIATHARIEHLIKFLESRHTPIQTTSFLTLVLGGTWKHVYSNVDNSRNSVPKITWSIHQEIVPDVSTSRGDIKNIVSWSYNTNDDSGSGKLVVASSYSVTPKGQLHIRLKEHLLLPDEMPSDPESLIMQLQRSIPFDFFDPDDSLHHTSYVDPFLRITRVTGEHFQGIVNIFVKDTPAPATLDEDEVDQEQRGLSPAA